MSCRLLVKHTENTNATGDIIDVFTGDHVFGKYESKLRFIESVLSVSIIMSLFLHSY